MNNAVLLSALVYPGSGHLLLKKYPMGIALIIISSTALSVIIYHAVQRANEIISKIQSGEMLPDVVAISEMLTQTDTQQMRIATIFFLIFWVVGIVDSYRISRKQT